MSDTWETFDWRSGLVPQTPPDEETRDRLSLPRTLRPVGSGAARQVPLFDPALKQYANAYRAGDPSFDDPELGRGWYTARRTAMDIVLGAVAECEHAGSLVLRGSVLLKAWFGDAAREPGDLDFVVTPHTWNVDEPRTDALLTAVARHAGAAAERTDLRFGTAIREEIWTYDRVPGLRLLLPWTARGLPGGAVQMDFVFNERLPVPPEPTAVPLLSTGGEAVLLAATPQLSLAWKMMWLMSDLHPQGKDLYDAVLLTEWCLPTYRMLSEVFQDADEEYRRRPVQAAHLTEMTDGVEWHHFAAEYPELAHSEREFTERLLTAAGRVLLAPDGTPRTEEDLAAEWFAGASTPGGDPGASA